MKTTRRPLLIPLLCVLAINLFSQITCTYAYSEDIRSSIKNQIKKKCQSCQLLLIDHDVLTGKLIRISGDSLEIESPNMIYIDPWHPMVNVPNRGKFSLDAIFEMRCGDSVYDGVIQGSIIGGLSLAFLGLIAMNIDPKLENERNYPYNAAAWGLVIGGTVGAAAGYLFDSLSGSPVEEIDLNRVRNLDNN